jgi:hypothetical protein
LKLVMTLLVRDEEDILEQHLRYHLAAGVDHIIATDNRSADGTRAILQAYARQGVLDYIWEPADDFAQTAWVTRMARLAAQRHHADWVINADADEFFWPEVTGGLKAALQAAPREAQALAVARHDFAPRPQVVGRPWHEAMVYRRTVSTNALGRPLPPKVCHRGAADIVVAQGNHSVSRWGELVQALPTQAVTILHFPVRSLAQLTHKIVTGGAAYERSSLPPETGATWRVLHGQHRTVGLAGYYDRLVATDEALPTDLTDGRLVLDVRLRDTLRSLFAPGVCAATPGNP